MRLIDADRLLGKLEKRRRHLSDDMSTHKITLEEQLWRTEESRHVTEVVEKLAGEVRTLQHGRWVIRPDDGTAECSECRRIMFLPMRCIENPAEIPYRYCDMCGAKMEGVGK